MRQENRETISVAQLIAPIVSSRDVVSNLRTAVNAADTKSVDLSFKNVDFISRSAAHELLSMKEDLLRKRDKKAISFINLNRDVKEMFRITAANRAAPKEEKPKFEAEKTDLSTLLKRVKV